MGIKSASELIDYNYRQVWANLSWLPRPYYMLPSHFPPRTRDTPVPVYSSCGAVGPGHNPAVFCHRRRVSACHQLTVPHFIKAPRGRVPIVSACRIDT